MLGLYVLAFIDLILQCGDIEQTKDLKPNNIKIFPFASGVLIASFPVFSEKKQSLNALL